MNRDHPVAHGTPALGAGLGVGHAASEPGVPGCVRDRERQLNRPGPGSGSQPGQHWPALDGLRAVAVLAVMVHHLNGAFPGGYLGVDVFFVLSGFLITSLLTGEWDRRGGRVSFRDFYARRALRLFPALGCVIVAAVVVAGLLELLGVRNAAYTTATFTGLPWVVLFAGDWPRAFDHASLGLLGHTWSLAVEEQFYLLWPTVFVLLLRRGLRRDRLAISLALIAVAQMICRTAAAHAGYSSDRVFFGADTRSDGLFIGCAVALWLASGRLTRQGQLPGRLLALAVWPAMTVLLLLFVHPSLVGGPTAMSAAVLASGVVLTGVVLGKVPRSLDRLLSSWQAVWIGRRSYGLYLWHYLIFTAAASLSEHYIKGFPVRLGQGQSIYAGYTGVVVVASFIAAVLSYHFVELPALRLKRRFREQPVSVPLPDEVGGLAQ